MIQNDHLQLVERRRNYVLFFFGSSYVSHLILETNRFHCFHCDNVFVPAPHFRPEKPDTKVFYNTNTHTQSLGQQSERKSGSEIPVFLTR